MRTAEFRVFPGQYYDQETGLHFNYFRYYDPETGRYITSDPIGVFGGLNTYANVGNTPMKGIDPYGLLTAYVYNGPTFPFTGNNPFGHTAVATTGSGVYSYGNTTPAGYSLTYYLARQAALRDTAVVILPTTPEQEAAINNYWAKHPNTNDANASNKNCAAHAANALSDAGVLPKELFIVDPAIYGLPYSQFEAVSRLPGATVIVIPKGGQVPSDLSEFNKP